MNLVVLNVAYPFAPVSPDAVGGAEQVLTQIDAALVRAGHESIIVACEGSRTAGIHVATRNPAGVLDEAARRQTYEEYRRVIKELLDMWPVDVIHMHGVDFHEYLPAADVPVLATLHLPPKWYPRSIFALRREQTYLNCVSARQRQDCPPCGYLLPEIENGITPELFSRERVRRPFAMAMGRICPEKGFHIALDAAKQAKVPMLLAGEVFRYEAHENYFHREIAPRLDRSRRFIGRIGLKRKCRLLPAARCLVAPSIVPETSSLVAMEALACGTPVIAFPSGALADIVENGKTGFLVRNESEMAEAIHAADAIDRNACREAARVRFSLDRMIAQYFETYQQLVDGAHADFKPGNVAARAA